MATGTHDAVVVGAGPAGLAVALAMTRRGLAPLVLDARHPPIDKACGEGLMPDGVAALAALGVALPTTDAAPFDGIRWIDGATAFDADFPAGNGWGVRRTRLHASLVAAVESAGVRVRWGEPVRAIEGSAVRTDAGLWEGRWIVGADGLRSTVRRLAGLDGPPARVRRFGRRRHFAVRPWTSRVEVRWDDEGEAYVTPVGAREVGIALLSGGGPATFERLADRFPRLARRLGGAAIVSEDRGAGPLEQSVRSVRRGRVVLVGDAAGYVDAITGEGLALAFRQAHALADAFVREDVGAWPRLHRDLTGRADRWTRAVRFLARRPLARRAAFRLLAARPALFGRLLALHVGEGAGHDPGLEVPCPKP